MSIGIPRLPRRPQVLFLVPQRHHFRPEGLRLQLVVQRRLRRVRRLLQPQRPDWSRPRKAGHLNFQRRW